MPFSPGQISEMLKIPASTLRRYSVDFADVLSESASVSGRKRVYTDSDVLLLRKIRELSSQRLEPDEIRSRLQILEPDLPCLKP